MNSQIKKIINENLRYIDLPEYEIIKAVNDTIDSLDLSKKICILDEIQDTLDFLKAVFPA